MGMMDELLLGLYVAFPFAYLCGMAIFALIPWWPESWNCVMDFWAMRIMACVLWPIFGIVLVVRRMMTK